MLVLLLSSVLSTIISALVIWAVQVGTQPVWREPIEESLKGVHVFQGEHGWWVLMAPGYAFWVTFFALVTFITFVFALKRCDA